ncbi:MAG TPA: hypothetical protein VI299_09980 [Polyangiales bacterium]
MRTTTTRALLFACAATVGCTSSGSEDAGADLGVGTASVAMLKLERFQQDAHTPSRFLTHAKVARYSGIDASSVLKLLGAEAREGEGCTVGSRLDTFPLAPEARVELLSIGDISLRSGDRAHTLSPRLFPDLASTASGWFYASGEELAEVDGGVEHDEYALAAAGHQGVGHFELSLSAPGAVTGLKFDGQARGTLTRSADVALSWEPEDMRDQLEIEIYAGSTVLSCSLRDDGQFTLPAAKLALLESDPQASMVVRRVLALTVDMQGIDSALVRFATTLTEQLAVR